MDGEKLAKSLTIYREKYAGLLNDQRLKELEELDDEDKVVAKEKKALDPKRVKSRETHQDKVLRSVIRCDSLNNFSYKEDPSTSNLRYFLSGNNYNETARLLAKKNFVDTVVECTEKILLHSLSMTELFFENGDIFPLYSVLGSLSLTKNKLIFYADYFKEGDVNPFSKACEDLSVIIESLTKKITAYHLTLVNTVILYDGESDDWSSSNALYEGERISVDVQFWWYYMNGLRVDLYNTISPSLAQKILENVFNDSLGVLTFRYCQISPSLSRLPQYRGDILAILMISTDFMLSLVPRLYDFFCPLPKHRFSRSVHTKCAALSLALTIVGIPLQSLYKRVQSKDEKKQNNKLDPVDGKNFSISYHEDDIIRWLSLTTLHTSSSTNIKGLSNISFVSLLTRQAALQPQPEWSIIVRLVLSRGMAFASLIMKNFGAFIPEDLPSENSMQTGCGFLMCTGRCIGVANKQWPQTVGTGVLYIVMHGNPEINSLALTLTPLLKNLTLASWEIFDSNLIWNLQKPVWYRALLDLLEPYFWPIVDDLIEDVEGGKTWTMSQISDALKKINMNISDMALIIPPSFYQACELIESLIPDAVRPLCDSIVVHLFYACLYSLVSKLIPVLRKWKMQREKLNFLIALGEKLCRAEPSMEMQKIEGLTDASSKLRTEKNYKWDDTDEEYINCISDMISNAIAEEAEGQKALKAVHKFVSYNSDWVRYTLGISVLAKNNDLYPDILKPWDSTGFEEPSPFHVIKQISKL